MGSQILVSPWGFGTKISVLISRQSLPAGHIPSAEQATVFLDLKKCIIFLEKLGILALFGK